MKFCTVTMKKVKQYFVRMLNYYAHVFSYLSITYVDTHTLLFCASANVRATIYSSQVIAGLA